MQFVNSIVVGVMGDRYFSATTCMKTFDNTYDDLKIWSMSHLGLPIKIWLFTSRAKNKLKDPDSNRLTRRE